MIGVGQLLFVIAMVPALLKGNNKPPRSTCLVTGSVLAVFAFTFYTLSLYYGAVTAAACAICWFVLLFQQRRR